MAASKRSPLVGVTSSRCIQPYRTLVYGAEKVGKTSFFAQAPDVIALDVEGRMGHVDVQKMPPILSWDDAINALEELRVKEHDFKNVLIDSVSALEKLVKIEVMREGNWNAAEADEFGRWLKVALSSYWPQFFAACERLERERGMGILMTAHLATKNMKNPGGEPYDRFRPALGGQEGPQLFLHFCHDLLYATFEDLVRVEKKGMKERVKTSTTGKRVMYTQHTPAWDAGNSCGLPRVMPFDWETYAAARLEGLSSLEDTYKQIAKLLPLVKDKAVRDAAKAHATENSESITVCRQVVARLHELIEDQEATAEPAEKSAE